MAKLIPKPKAGEARKRWERQKEQQRERDRGISERGRDIRGQFPRVQNYNRKWRARKSFRAFCESYFPGTFTLDWSKDHLRIIAKIEKAVKEGGLFAMATPRGFGKTSLCEAAALWALCTALHEFVLLVGSDTGHARLMLESIKTELEMNELLLADWPEIVYPIHRLEGIYQRTGGQLFREKSTRIEWTADVVVLPTLPRSKASGGIIRVAGIEARIRGMKYKRGDGRTVRPSLVFLDDPQTDESARSPQQVYHRMETLNGAILNLAGPGKKISGILPCTVIQPGDMADQILDRKLHPIWQGERTRLVYEFPVNTKLWDKYAEIRADSLRADGDGREATVFYKKHRGAMDEGAVTAWPANFNKADEISSIQHAMNLLLRDERSFWAEHQNEPLPPEEERQNIAITVEQIMEKVGGIERGRVSIGNHTLTMFIDVQGKLLYWVVVAWGENFTGYVIDYGTYPDQKIPRFTLESSTRTLQRMAPRAGLEGSIYAGLEKLAETTLAREWTRDDDVKMKIDRCLVDANWGKSTDVVYRFCRQSVHSSVLLPSHGRFVGAGSIPMDQYHKKPGDKVGLNWRIPGRRGTTRQVRHVIYDTNYWKSFLVNRLNIARGDLGALLLFGHSKERHRMFAEHLVSEYCVPTEGRGRKVEEWKLRMGGSENHWLDGLVGCYVGASIQGVALFKSVAGPKKAAIRLSQLKKEKTKMAMKKAR